MTLPCWVLSCPSAEITLTVVPEAPASTAKKRKTLIQDEGKVNSFQRKAFRSWLFLEMKPFLFTLDFARLTLYELGGHEILEEFGS